MISLGNAIVSEDIVEKFFVCDLIKCKGACCVEGDMGAPLEMEEAMILEEIYPLVKPYLSKDGIRVIEEHGTSAEAEDGELVTPTIGNNRECAYAIYENKILKCGIEKAYNEGKVTFQKPISCHLYPIRITKYDEFEAVNYERWNICNPACSNGRDLGVPIYKFLKGPLTRKFGQQWYNDLCKEIDQKKL
ncbi:MAG: DUF3109 family protein [Cytophagales bacterium]|nr:DUF3109 family protein [Cytophaga sp.]